MWGEGVYEVCGGWEVGYVRWEIKVERRLGA